MPGGAIPSRNPIAWNSARQCETSTDIETALKIGKTPYGIITSVLAHHVHRHIRGIIPIGAMIHRIVARVMKITAYI